MLINLWHTWVDVYALALTVVVVIQNRALVQRGLAWVGDRMRGTPKV